MTVTIFGLSRIAKTLGVHPSTASALCHGGWLPAFRVRGQWALIPSMIPAYVAVLQKHDMLRRRNKLRTVAIAVANQAANENHSQQAVERARQDAVEFSTWVRDSVRSLAVEILTPAQDMCQRPLSSFRHRWRRKRLLTDEISTPDAGGSLAAVQHPEGGGVVSAAVPHVSSAPADKKQKGKEGVLLDRGRQGRRMAVLRAGLRATRLRAIFEGRGAISEGFQGDGDGGK